MKIAILALLSIAVVGCGKTSPFLAAMFNGTLPGVPAGGGGGGGGDDDPPATGVFDFLSDIPIGLRTFTSQTFNSSEEFPVRHRKLFTVTAGPGGFVDEDAAILDYVAAGYRDLIPPGSPLGTSIEIGCVTLRLTRGTRLLGKVSGTVLGQDFFIPPQDFAPQVDRRDDNQSAILPLPEFIVFTTDNPNFGCENPDRPCTQEAFQYFRPSLVEKVGKSPTSERIQGTVCNIGLGNSPSARLDKTDDGMSVTFQYVPGCDIVWRVLDRANDLTDNNRVQVVWTVSVGDVVIHGETP